MTAPKRWPNVVAEQRDRAGEEAVRGIRLLSPLVDGVQFDRTETLRRIAQGLQCFQQIAWLMHAAGAPIQPQDVN